MEIACGEYGDVVPKLVVAAQSDSCVKLQNACMAEIKPNNCDKSVRHCAVLDPKYLLQDGINIDSMSLGYSELLSVQKLEHDIDTVEIDDTFPAMWKTMNILSSDKSTVSSKPVSCLISLTVCKQECLICEAAVI